MYSLFSAAFNVPLTCIVLSSAIALRALYTGTSISGLTSSSQKATSTQPDDPAEIVKIHCTIWPIL
nr:MAG TPA: hypothetical protein [Caudoviricetes sp.]DAT09117.1 MAG TPA: hypothetical protein [Caudoviricetes sp.]